MGSKRFHMVKGKVVPVIESKADIDLLSVAELKGELKSYGLFVSGKKKELRARLKVAIAYEGIKNPKADMKKAVELLLESYWFGWDDGKPHIFDKMFDKYGTFVPSVGKASSMVGTPDKWTSKINLAARGEGQTVKMLMMQEGKIVLQKMLNPKPGERGAPALQEAFKDMPPQSVVYLIEHDGEKYEFEKHGPGKYYIFKDKNNKPHIIPRWAIG